MTPKSAYAAVLAPAWDQDRCLATGYEWQKCELQRLCGPENGALLSLHEAAPAGDCVDKTAFL